MNAQSTHPIFTSQTDTTDPQFLGPEAGQQADGTEGGNAEGSSGFDGQRISKPDANGTELHRYFSVTRGALISVRSNGVTLFHQIDDDWKVLSRKKADVQIGRAHV